MDARTTTDWSGRLRQWLGRRLAALDRGWKATLLGVGIVLGFALAL